MDSRTNFYPRAIAKDAMDEFVLQSALNELGALVQEGGFVARDAIALLSIMNVQEVLEYLDARMSLQFH